MNEHANIKEGDNTNKKFNEFNVHLDAIESCVLKAQKHLNAYNQAIFQALGRTLDLGHLFVQKRDNDGDKDWSFLKDFFEAHDERWNAKCDTSFFHGLVAVAFNKVTDKGEPISSAPSLSRYRAVLRFAFEENMTGAQLIAQLSDLTLTGFYNKAVEHFQFDPLDRYVEDDEDRFRRSVRYFFKQKGQPELTYSDDFPKPQATAGFATALVRVRNQKMQFVRFFDESDEDKMKLKVASLVPDEAKRRRKKLSDKNLYWLYVTCDIFTRFLPKIADRTAWAKASEAAKVPVIGPDSTTEEIENYLSQVQQLGSARRARSQKLEAPIKTMHSSSQMMQKFVLLDALEFANYGSDWTARTITTFPNTPCVEVTLGDNMHQVLISSPLCIKDIEASRFTNDFLTFEEWKFDCRSNIDVIVSGSHKTPSMQFLDMQGLASWRTLDPQLNSVARFALGRDKLHALDGWKAEYADVPRFGRRAFQSILSLRMDGNDLMLSQSRDKDHSKALGHLISGVVPVFKEPRFFDFKFCEKLIELAKDYGITFEFELLEGHQNMSAIRVFPVGFPVEASITLPLMLSNKGNPVEITMPI